MMQAQETSNGNPSASWAENAGWKWLTEEEEANDSQAHSPVFMSQGSGEQSFIRHHVKLAHDFSNSRLGHDSISKCLPTAGGRSIETRKAALSDTIVALHLLLEEQKLDTMISDSFSTGVASLTPILAQMTRWVGWASWVQAYEVEEASLPDAEYDTRKFRPICKKDLANNVVRIPDRITIAPAFGLSSNI